MGFRVTTVSDSDRYPFINRVFINGEWIGSELYKEYIDINAIDIDIGTILGMNGGFKSYIHTPASTSVMYADTIHLNTEIFSMCFTINTKNTEMILLNMACTNCLILINKESVNQLCIELIKLPDDLAGYYHSDNIKFPLWWSDTSCIFGIEIQRTLCLLNDRHEPLTVLHLPYNSTSKKRCDAYADYLNASNIDMRNSEGIVPKKLVIYQGKPWIVKKFIKDVIDGHITETKQILLESISIDPLTDVKESLSVDLQEFLERCVYVSPHPVNSPDIMETIAIVTLDDVFKYIISDGMIATLSYKYAFATSMEKFLDAYNAILDHMDKKQVQNSDYIDRMVSILTILLDQVPKNAIFILRDGSACIAKNNTEEYFKDAFENGYDYYTWFEEDSNQSTEEETENE